MYQGIGTDFFLATARHPIDDQELIRRAVSAFINGT
jgi:hypothetical protein